MAKLLSGKSKTQQFNASKALGALNKKTEKQITIKKSSVSSQIQKAEKTLLGHAPTNSQYCKPYCEANEQGYWLYSPVDVDLIWYGGNKFDLRQPQNEQSKSKQNYKDMVKYSSVQANVITIWTGITIQTPKDWSIQVREPVNFAGCSIYSVQEAILPSGDKEFEISINLEFQQQDKWLQLRKSGIPIAQVIPVYNQANSAWKLNESKASSNGKKSSKYHS
jgi:hypothetical protein